jgi:tetratricopeptide (TPR) repeat protein
MRSLTDKILGCFTSNHIDIHHPEFVSEAYFKNYRLMEGIFQQLIEHHANDIPLLQSMASCKLQVGKLSEAIALLKYAIWIQPANYDVLIQYYVYSGMSNNRQFNEIILQQLHHLNPARTEAFIKTFDRMEQFRKIIVPTQIPKYPENHQFILLGRELDDNGKMTEPLIKRLAYTLEILVKNPTGKVLMTGGFEKKGAREAWEMKKWLVARGVEKENILVEAESIDTIQNAAFSFDILNGVDVTFITSASHLRRAWFIFDNVNQVSTRKIDGLGEIDDEAILASSTENERLLMYYDALRLGGIWQYPTVYR